MPVGLRKVTPFRNGTPFKKNRRQTRLDDIQDDRNELSTMINSLSSKTLTNPFAGMENAFGGLANPFADQENPFADIQAPKFQTEFENKMEDLGVNTKAAEFAQQQFQQSQAATLQSMKEAGLSGSQVQQMANKSLEFASGQRADIGGQEAQNKALAAKGAMGVQEMEMKAKKDQAIASFETDKLIKQGQFDVDKLIGSAQLDVDKTTMEGEWKRDMAVRGGEADLQNLELQRDQAAMALKAGLIEGDSAELASTKWYQRSRG